MPRALLSVSNKQGIEPFAQALADLGFDLISTGGTYRAITDAGTPIRYITEVTTFPEILGGRVKTLHPMIHGGILATNSETHLSELQEHSITRIDMVVVNLYPFRETVAKGVDLSTALENIDIGGPTMLRAAAKNFPNVIVVVDPADYDDVLVSLRKGEVPLEQRQRLAVKAFAHTAAYDAAITRYLSPDLPSETALELTRISTLRYGENPHQRASLWRLGNERGAVIDAEILHGKEMSFNNYGDADAAWNLLSELPTPSVVAVKHANPCGVATAGEVQEAYRLAHAADPVSIFGGIVAVNVPVTEALAQELSKTFLEIILAPDYDEAALAILTKKANLRLLKVTEAGAPGFDLRRVQGGLLVQDADMGTLEDCDLKVVTKREPTDSEWQDLRFAWKVCKHTKSNAIVLAKGGVTTGIGMGQVSRIWAAQGALERAGEGAKGSAMASDAFFPFDDVVRTAAAGGVTSVIAPGGSKRDPEVIAACDELGLAMVFTGMRHFKH